MFKVSAEWDNGCENLREFELYSDAEAFYYECCATAAKADGYNCCRVYDNRLTYRKAEFDNQYSEEHKAVMKG